MPDTVRITDVAPRDGLQNESARVPTDRKADLVRAIARTGVDEVEVTSFVSPKWIPQLGDAAELCELLAESKPEGVIYSALVPNDRGMERLTETNALAHADHGVERLIDKVSVFTAASETFSRKNTNAAISDTIERFRPVRAAATAEHLRMRAYISCVISCPFEGPIAPDVVAGVARQLVDLGTDEIDLGDTIGAATPDTIAALLNGLREELDEDWFAPEKLTLHLHDTHGNASSCVRTALDLGVRSFDGASGGLGGCPYASTPDARAPGNIPTSALVRTVEEAGFETSVNAASLADADTVAGTVISQARDAAPEHPDT
jgi:hydroxymethylglutaryl-CoA lyase